MKVILTGSTGQLGKSIIESKPLDIDLITTTREQLDLTQPKLCEEFILLEKPDWIINCAAYTAVDQAEKDIELCRKVNSYAPEAFAKAINRIDGKILHISTDFVFDGEQNFPYQVNQKKNPINQYGYSKALGEDLIQDRIKNIDNVILLRTSWLISPYSKNFILNMLKLHAEKDFFNVVHDQIGAPTSAKHLAKVCWKIIKLRHTKTLPTIMHWRDNGIASWYDLAVAVGEIGKELGILNKNGTVIPVNTDEYSAIANRPKFSLLDIKSTSILLKTLPNHWRSNLFEILKEYKKLQLT